MKIRTFTLLTLTAALVACSALPERNSSLDRARGRFNAAQRDPQVTTLASAELQQAEDTLGRACPLYTSRGVQETGLLTRRPTRQAPPLPNWPLVSRLR